MSTLLKDLSQDELALTYYLLHSADFVDAWECMIRYNIKSRAQRPLRVYTTEQLAVLTIVAVKVFIYKILLLWSI